MKLQSPGHPILIGGWSRDEDFGIHPVGSKPKETVICPETETRPFLIPGHHYLFKIGAGWKAQQLWSEIIAYQIGCLVGVPVPPAFLAYNERTNEMGVLVEFFYGYPGERDPARFFHGIDFIRRFRKVVKGDRPHELRTNLAICRRYNVPSGTDWWARTLAFDALIGNTDRHTENWGLLIRAGPGKEHHYELAPAYDNGTSLGFQPNLSKFQTPEAITKFIAKGKHHCGWDRRSDAPTPHMDLCERFAAASRRAGAIMRNVVRFDESELRTLINRNVCDGITFPFRADRADFMTKIVLARRAWLKSVLGA